MVYKSLLAQAIEYFQQNRNTKSEVEKLQADVDYISMMSDVEFPTEDTTNTEEVENNGTAE